MDAVNTAAIVLTLKAGPNGLSASLYAPQGPFTIDGQVFAPVKKCSFAPDSVGDGGKVWYACSECGGKISAEHDSPRFCPHCGALNEGRWV